MDLAGIPYDPSFPEVHVGIEGGDGGVAAEGQLQDEPDAAAGDEPGQAAEAGETSPSAGGSDQPVEATVGQAVEQRGNPGGRGQAAEESARVSQRQASCKPVEDKEEDKPRPHARQPPVTGPLPRIRGRYVSQKAQKSERPQALGFRDRSSTRREFRARGVDGDFDKARRSERAD
jgi:hypothetical protein